MEGGERKHLIKSTRSLVNCHFLLSCVTEFTHCLWHGLQSYHLKEKLFFVIMCAECPAILPHSAA